MLFEIGVYRLNVDVERTKAYYAAQGGNIGCDCAGCRNYEKACHQLSAPIQSFLRQFGITPEHPINLSTGYLSDGARVVYDGMFYICGTILAGNNPWIQTGPKSRKIDPDYTIDLDPDSSAYLEEPFGLLDLSFPHPVIQLEIIFTLPWLLEEPNPYLWENHPQ